MSVRAADKTKLDFVQWKHVLLRRLFCNGEIDFEALFHSVGSVNNQNRDRVTFINVPLLIILHFTVPMELIVDLNAMISVGTTLSVLGLLYFAGKMALATFVPRKSIPVDEEKSFQSFEDGCVVYRTSDDELPQFTPQSLEKFNGVNNPLYVALLVRF